MQQNEDTLYTRYCKLARKLEIAGGVLLIAALAANAAAGGHALISLAMLLGLALFIYGAMNLRPNNLVKAFAAQLQATCDRDFALALLEALQTNRRVGLSGRSINHLELALDTYAQREGTDKELAEELIAAAKKHVYKILF